MKESIKKQFVPPVKKEVLPIKKITEKDIVFSIYKEDDLIVIKRDNEVVGSIKDIEEVGSFISKFCYGH